MGRSIKRAERSMSKIYLLYDPDQQLLLPAALQEWLPPDHLAYFISDVVDQRHAGGGHRCPGQRRSSLPLSAGFSVLVQNYTETTKVELGVMGFV